MEDVFWRSKCVLKYVVLIKLVKFDVLSPHLIMLGGTPHEISDPPNLPDSQDLPGTPRAQTLEFCAGSANHALSFGSQRTAFTPVPNTSQDSKASVSIGAPSCRHT